MSSLSPSLVTALSAAADVICTPHFEQLLREIEASKTAMPPPLVELVEAAANCLRPLSLSGDDPNMIRRADYRVLVAQTAAYRKATGLDESLVFILALFADNGLFTEIDREMNSAN